MVRIELPVVQNWSCHNCGGCCRQHLIEITDEERRRIESQGWTAADGVPGDRPLIVESGGWLSKKRQHLGHQADGACVFLNEKGLCRIHAKFGEAAKPLACRVYPYAMHPAGKGVTVSLRYSCPSVVANLGKPLRQQKGDIQEIARLVVPEGFERYPPPAVHARETFDWPDTLRIVQALDTTLGDEGAPFVVRLVWALAWMKLVEQSKFEKVRGDRVDEFLELVREAAAAEIMAAREGSEEDENLGWLRLFLGEPTAAGRMQFRMLVAQYARRDTAADAEAGWRHRWQLGRSALRFARGAGSAPPLQDAFREVPFESIERPFGELPDGTEELFERYFRVKVAGLHFCGPAYYDVPVAEGFVALALMYPVTLWLARWLAAGESRATLSWEDVQNALAIADHHHGYSDALGTGTARRRTRLLTTTGDAARLCAWYGATESAGSS